MTNSLVRLPNQRHRIDCLTFAKQIIHMRAQYGFTACTTITEHFSHITSRWHGPMWRLMDAIWWLDYRLIFPEDKALQEIEQNTYHWIMQQHAHHKKRYPFVRAIEAYKALRARMGFGEERPSLFIERPEQPNRKLQKSLLTLYKVTEQTKKLYLYDMVHYLTRTPVASAYGVRAVVQATYLLEMYRARGEPDIRLYHRVENGIAHCKHLIKHSKYLDSTPVLEAYNILKKQRF